MKLIRINPITRLEGEGVISIILDDQGNVKDAYYHIIEFKGFEKFCIGRPVEELPRIVTRICGVCPWAHHMASGKAVDQIYGRDPSPAAKKIRELAYCAHVIDSHMLHFFYLAAPDFLAGPGAPKEERNVIGLFKKNPDLVKDIVKHRSYAVKVTDTIGGKAIHPVCNVPGGVSKPLSEEDVKEFRGYAKELIKFSLNWIEKFEKEILNKYKDLIFSDLYYAETYYMGIVDNYNRMNFYDGMVRVVDPKGNEVAKFQNDEYANYIAEKVVRWSYTKFPYLKKVGWKGLSDGIDSGMYRVGPLARLNVSDKLATDRAQEVFERFKELGGHPCHYSMFYHYARLIEILYAAERMLELLEDEEILSKDIVNYDGEPTYKGVGIAEAPRGILFHHYETDENLITRRVNIIIPTTQNNLPINYEIKKAAQKMIKNGQVNDEILNLIEVAFRTYDPCLACSAHAINQGPLLRVRILRENGEVVKELPA